MKKTAFISVIGRANVGKSSLVNRIIGQKISIVSSKPQTTRTRIMGVKTEGEIQYVFIDTPGFHIPHNKLGDNMIKAVKSGMTDVDAAILVVDCAAKFKFDPENIPQAEKELLKSLKNRNVPCVLAINKIDLLDEKDKLLEFISGYSDYFDFNSVVPVSAKKGDGINILESELKTFAKPSEHYFSDDEYTDQPDRVIVSEIIREKILRLLKGEVPHGIAVDIERFFERDSKKNGEPIIEIEATIICEKESHKGIIIGKGGEMLKKIGTYARQDLERFFGTKCSVKLWVKVKEDWRNRSGIIHTLGLDSE